LLSLLRVTRHATLPGWHEGAATTWRGEKLQAVALGLVSSLRRTALGAALRQYFCLKGRAPAPRVL